MADTDERAEPEEKVGQLVEVAVEDEADRHDLIVALDRRGLGRDRLELDPGLLSDPRQLEQDARHVGDRRHRLGEPEDVGDRDRLGVGRSNGGGAGGRDGLLGRCRLGLELGGERPLRRDEHEPEAERVDDQADGDQDVERTGRELPLHDESPAVLTSARIVNRTSVDVPDSVVMLDWRRTLVRVGATARRAMRRATPLCE